MMKDRVTGPLIRLSSIWEEVMSLRLSLGRLESVFGGPEERSVTEEQSTASAFRKSIVLQSVSFTYPGQTVPAIENLTLELKRGQRLCLLGESGAGKSTVLRLLTGNYTDYKGEILFDNKDVRTLTLQSVRSQFSSVLQKNVLFSGTIESNILFASERQDKLWMECSAKLACANKFIEDLPNGYQSTVNEQGSNYSGGQVQRIALARALAANTPLLVLDEATSALDAETEYVLVENLRRLKRKKTLLIATHRLSLARMCDHIVVLKKGKIAEQGNHRLLMHKKGAYFKLQQLQSGAWDGEEACI